MENQINENSYLNFIGFETIGNATIIGYDHKPIIATDPWICGSAYFGSWVMSHEIPTIQREAVEACPYIWLSHGHPDHINSESLPLLKNSLLLIPDHVGQRINNDLIREGYKTQIIPNRKWVQLSPNIKIQCISDYFLDAILLMDIAGRLLVNTNDALDRGWGHYVRSIIKQYDISFLLSLFGYGDADMINFFTEEGTFVAPKAALKKPVGPMIKSTTESYGVSYFIPFSSLHHYQREDSIWANSYITELADYALDFHSKTVKILPAFVHYNCKTDEYFSLNPEKNEPRVLPSTQFGDDWSEKLTSEEKEKLKTYFLRIKTIGAKIGFLRFVVGGEENVIVLNPQIRKRGISFEVPRSSLMIAVDFQIFDDLLIGNFMKTTLHGNWPQSKLYPDFIPYVARYADNAYRYTKEEIELYFEEYRKRAPLEFFKHQFEYKAVNLFRSFIADKSWLYQFGKKMYWLLKK